MKNRKLSSIIGFEKLELRRLLAADCCLPTMPEAEIAEPVQCEVDTFQCCCEETAATDSSTESTADIAETDTATPDLDPRSLDLADGIDGYFGSINSENPAETIEFTAAEDGMVNVVLTSSFGDGNAVLAISNSQGDLIEPQSAGVTGFDMSSFEAKEGETYQLSISSDNADCEGHFQLTVAFQGFEDQHVNEVGCDSTELELVDNSAELAGRLESAGDTDTFRLTATSSGEMTLELQETVDDSRIGLDVAIQDASGNLLAEGATNESLQISFDAEAGQEYFVSIAAGEGQKGTYQFGLTLEPAVDQSVDCEDSDVIDETVDVDPSEDADLVEIECELIDSEIADEPIIDQADEIVDLTDDQSAADLSGALVNCVGEETTDSDDNSDSEPVTVPVSVPVDCDLIIAGDGQTTDGELETGGSFIGLDNQGVIDNFFAVYGNELELHFNFFFGVDSLGQNSLRG